MGCDIHMHSQIKVNGQWIWHNLNIYNDRNYILFGILDGTRDDTFKPIAPNKGFPHDSADPLKLVTSAWENNDYETVGGVYLGYAGVSYLTLTELLSFDWTQEVYGFPMTEWDFVQETMSFLMGIANQVGGTDNVRIVFGYTV